MRMETETKILGINQKAVAQLMEDMGAAKILETKFTVRWYRLSKNDNWHLRIRQSSNGSAEMTWKSIGKITGISRVHEEININISDAGRTSTMLRNIGLSEYAYQEKFRTSWSYMNWKFDLDIYPGMPPYLEIEGSDDNHIKEAVKILGLEKNEISAEGEKALIEQKYGLNWHDMRFS